MPPAPKEIERNRFDEWCWRRGIDLRQAAEALDCSIEQVRLIRMPFSDDRRRVPAKSLMERIVAYTEGAISVADFYPEHFSNPTGVANDADARPPSGEARG